jgi:L-asparaginase
MNSERILIVTTGGTFDKQYFDALSAYTIAETIVPRLLGTALTKQPIRVVELLRKDSLELTDEDRARIVAEVAAAPERLAVIIHGTDTMAQTAEGLGKAASGKVIALTGAFTPARFAESDAAFNLGMAVATVQVAPPGVYIAMSGQVFEGTRVRKDREAGAFVPKG